MNVELPHEMSDFVKGLIAEGRFESEAAVVTAGLKLLDARETLRQALQKGVNQFESGQWKDEETVFAILEAGIKRVEEEHHKN